MEEKVTLAANTAWELRNNIPYFEVRNGLYAKLGRSVYYNLVEMAVGCRVNGGLRHVTPVTDDLAVRREERATMAEGQ